MKTARDSQYGNHSRTLPGASTDCTAVLAATGEKEDHQQVLCAEVLTKWQSIPH